MRGYDSLEGFDPEDHGIEDDELAKLYAQRDMEDERLEAERQQAYNFYSDFETLDIETSIQAVVNLVKCQDLTIHDVNEMIDNMIKVFEGEDAFEKCGVCLKIKEGVNAKI